MSKQTPIIKAVTEWLGLRRSQMWLRYKEDLSSRSPPQPNLPPGVNHKLSNNYYYMRDSRREVEPSTLISASIKQIEDGSQKSECESDSSVSFPTPGVSLKWTISKDEPHLT